MQQQQPVVSLASCALLQFYAFVEERQKVHCLNTLFSKVSLGCLLCQAGNLGALLLALAGHSVIFSPPACIDWASLCS